MEPFTWQPGTLAKIQDHSVNRLKSCCRSASQNIQKTVFNIGLPVGLRWKESPKVVHGCSPMYSGSGLHCELDIIHLWMPATSRHVLLLSFIELFHREWTEFALGWSITYNHVIQVVERL